MLPLNDKSLLFLLFKLLVKSFFFLPYLLVNNEGKLSLWVVIDEYTYVACLLIVLIATEYRKKCFTLDLTAGTWIWTVYSVFLRWNVRGPMSVTVSNQDRLVLMFTGDVTLRHLQSSNDSCRKIWTHRVNTPPAEPLLLIFKEGRGFEGKVILNFYFLSR